MQLKTDKTLDDVAYMFNKQIQGWSNYYTHYYKSGIYGELKYINRCLVKWVRSKYKSKKSNRQAQNWLGRIARRNIKLFAHWKFGIIPSARIMGAV